MGDFKLPLVEPDSPLDVTRFDFSAPVASITLPEAARYAGATMQLLRWRPSEAPHNLFAPTAGTLRLIELPAGVLPPGEGHTVWLTELSPHPFAIAETLRGMRLGLPTFYLGYGLSSFRAQDDFVAAGEPLLNRTTTPSDMFLGVAFADRVPLPPVLWIDALLEAMPSGGSDRDRGNWEALRAAITPAGRRIRLVDHVGRPFTPPVGRSLAVRTSAGAVVTPRIEGGVVELPADAADLSVSGAPEARMVYAFYAADAAAGFARSQAAPADAAAPSVIALPPGLRDGVLQLLDLDAWFARRPAPPPEPPWPSWRALERYHLASRVEPLVDGDATFTRMIDDMLAAGQSGGGFHVTAYSVDEFPMLASHPGIGHPSIAEISRQVIAAGGGARFLVSKILNLSDEQWRRLAEDAQAAGAGGAVALAGGAIIMLSIPELTGSWDAWVAPVVLAVHTIAAGIAMGVVGSLSQEEFRNLAEGIAELSLAGMKALNELGAGPLAFWSHHPAEFADNPFAQPPHDSLPLDLHNYITHFGGWHQKAQVVRRRAPGGAGTLHAAYVGGIDIHPNRRDNPGHHGAPYTHPSGSPNWVEHPFHDVHARVTGPAAADIFQTVDERYERELASNPDPASVPAKAFAPPLPGALAAEVEGATHIVQVARTYHRPGPGSTPLRFSPAGETTIHEGLINAIRQAREYIYIEDQYFTPSGETAGDGTLVGALLEAAEHPDTRLVLLAPNFNDQPFGNLRRDHLYELLRHAWGERFVLGSPVRRPLLPPAGLHAHRGRCWLHEAIGPGDTELALTPRSRVQGDAPYWLWVEGELMLCTAVLRSEGLVTHAEVARGNTAETAEWGVRARAHPAKAPVTLSQLKGIFVHSKMMIVDDCFVSIGSANYNRRGLFHDGELNVFAIPEELRGAPENPARALRVALWAEHLGLSPAMGSILLRDARGALPLFERSYLIGNRFAPIELFEPGSSLASGTTAGPGREGLAFALKATGSVVSLTGALAAGALTSELWAKAVDPTTADDPDEEPGPV